MIEDFRKALDAAASQGKKLVLGTNEQDWQPGAKGLLAEAALVIHILRRATKQEYEDNQPDGYPPRFDCRARFYYEIEILETLPYREINIPLTPTEPTPGGRPQ